MGGCVSATLALAGCRLLRGDGAGPALYHPRGVGHQGQPSAVVMDGWALQSNCESGPHGGGYFGAPTGGACHAGRRTGACAQRLCQDVQRATGGAYGATGLGLPGLHGRGCIQGGAEQRDRSADCEAARGEEGLRAAAPVLGGGAALGLAGKIPRASQDYERLPEVLDGLYFLVFAMLMLPAAVRMLVVAVISKYALAVRTAHDACSI